MILSNTKSEPNGVSEIVKQAKNVPPSVTMGGSVTTKTVEEGLNLQMLFIAIVAHNARVKNLFQLTVNSLYFSYT